PAALQIRCGLSAGPDIRLPRAPSFQGRAWQAGSTTDDGATPRRPARGWPRRCGYPSRRCRAADARADRPAPGASPDGPAPPSGPGKAIGWAYRAAAGRTAAAGPAGKGVHGRMQDGRTFSALLSVSWLIHDAIMLVWRRFDQQSLGKHP